MRSLICACIVILFLAAPSLAEASETGEGEVFTFVVPESMEAKGMSYYVFVPEGVKKSKRYPLVHYFHGNGNKPLQSVEALRNLSTRKDPVFVLVPHYQMQAKYKSALWPSWNVALEMILDEMIKKYPVDDSRVYAYGFSNKGSEVSWAFLMDWHKKRSDTFPYRGYILHSPAGLKLTPEEMPDISYVFMAGGKENQPRGYPYLKKSREEYATMLRGKRDARYYEIPEWEHGLNRDSMAFVQQFLRTENSYYEVLKGKKYEGVCETIAPYFRDSRRWKAGYAKLQELEKDETLSSSEQSNVHKLLNAVRAYCRQKIRQVERSIGTTGSVAEFILLEIMAEMFTAEDLGEVASAAAEKVGKKKKLQRELAAREMFWAAVNAEIKSADEGLVVYLELVQEHAETEYGMRGQQRLQALGLGSR